MTSATITPTARWAGPAQTGLIFVAMVLLAEPGACTWLGAGGVPPSAPLHSLHVDFNDDTLTLGAVYRVALVMTALGLQQAGMGERRQRCPYFHQGPGSHLRQKAPTGQLGAAEQLWRCREVTW